MKYNKYRANPEKYKERKRSIIGNPETGNYIETIWYEELKPNYTSLKIIVGVVLVCAIIYFFT